jgi:hypothetical protein
MASARERPTVVSLGALPSYRDLPPVPRGGRSAWNVFGPTDSIGLLNLQTPSRIAAAARGPPIYGGRPCPSGSSTAS